MMKLLSAIGVLSLLAIPAAPLSAQPRPDFSGVWRLDAEESQLTWVVDHRDPEISVIVNVRDSQGTHQFSFRCTTDGQEYVKQLPSLREVRRVTVVWEDSVLVVSQQADSPHGEFQTRDRISLIDSGERLVFEQIVANPQDDGSVRQVFQKVGPPPSRRRPPEPLPSVELPSELDRVLRDYEQHWRAGNGEALAELFTEDGFAARRGGWIRGRAGLRDELQGSSGHLCLRAVAYEIGDEIAYIIGAYGYGDEPSVADRGMFILTLRRGDGDRWLIAADLDAPIRP